MEALNIRSTWDPSTSLTEKLHLTGLITCDGDQAKKQNAERVKSRILFMAINNRVHNTVAP
jgi:hypothetical protein